MRSILRTNKRCEGEKRATEVFTTFRKQKEMPWGTCFTSRCTWPTDSTFAKFHLPHLVRRNSCQSGLVTFSPFANMKVRHSKFIREFSDASHKRRSNWRHYYHNDAPLQLYFIFIACLVHANLERVSKTNTN